MKYMMNIWYVRFYQVFHQYNTHLTFTCSKSIIETLEKGMKYVQS